MGQVEKLVLGLMSEFLGPERILDTQVENGWTGVQGADPEPQEHLGHSGDGGQQAGLQDGDREPGRWDEGRAEHWEVWCPPGVL